MHISSWITRATYTHSEYVIILLLQGNNGYANAPQCYLIYTLPVLPRYLVQQIFKDYQSRVVKVRENWGREG